VIRHFWGSLAYTAVSLVVGFCYGGWSACLIVAALGCLEVSLSMDNAVVNARGLAAMSPRWQRRFLTWGMLIAVVGMRVAFPLMIVSAAAWISPRAAVLMALQTPDQYAAVLASAHIQITGFGGAFLLMLFFNYFIDDEKEVHWIGVVERGATSLGHVNNIAVAVTMFLMLLVSFSMPTASTAIHLLQCATAGVVSYILAEGFADIVGGQDEAKRALARAGAGGFVFLEIQDASFSFDGVIGALAVSNNLVVIALGLGIGAMFVRSITLLLVERGSLKSLPYLEHGAFWAVGAMAVMMFAKLHIEIPDAATGLVMAAIIGSALLSSIFSNRQSARQTEGVV
jgi:hypothetical protein